ncbi:Endonuclease/exonuclease/phosphatase,Reverse transcriptase domain [Cinara cedri]|uniref:Endonuclease/exonuclease/phosphatase,Reverse transcriptase domain n=1 Tax=Cinara cedri TaxID=506608 RepID=A0A5E4NBK4_9HEMI|nr:Endonuclease/exonuclease/phosphatase,Reverse transcriptase domain [Cinara cedri]
MLSSLTNKSHIILLFNANGIKNHVIELQHVLYNRRIDIALITETHFTLYSKISIPGYFLLKTNHRDGTAHGGVAILIKSQLQFQPLPCFSHDFLQSCAISIQLNNIPVVIATVYSPPKYNITLNNLSNYFETISNTFNNFIIRLSSHIILDNVLSHSQFGFRCKHNTIHQVHRVVDVISSSLEKKQYCTCVFLDISQAFDRVWHQGLLFKLRKCLPSALFLLIKSYLDNRHFQTRVGIAFSNISAINACVPQVDQPTLADTIVADYADDKAIISMHENPDIASASLQFRLDLMADCLKIVLQNIRNQYDEYESTGMKRAKNEDYKLTRHRK